MCKLTNILDELVPIERMELMQKGEAFDRYPCVPFLGDSSAAWFGLNVREYWHSAENIVNVEIETFNLLGHDGLGVGPDAYGIAEALGADVIFPLHSGPYVKHGVINNLKEVRERPILNVDKDGRCPMFLEACKVLRDKAEGIVGVGSSIAGPFTIAGYLRGIGNLLRDLYKNPEGVHELMRYVTDSCKCWVDAVAGLDVGISMADPLASPSLLNPKLYGEFVFPYTKELIDYVYSKLGTKVAMHMCGNTYPIWEELKKYNLASLSFDNVIDMQKAKMEFQDLYCILGNVDPVWVISKGEKNEIEESVKGCINTMRGARKGYSVASGCQIPIGTSKRNVEFFVDAVRKYSLAKR